MLKGNFLKPMQQFGSIKSVGLINLYYYCKMKGNNEQSKKETQNLKQ